MTAGSAPPCTGPPRTCRCTTHCKPEPTMARCGFKPGRSQQTRGVGPRHLAGSGRHRVRTSDFNFGSSISQNKMRNQMWQPSSREAKGRGTGGQGDGALVAAVDGGEGEGADVEGVARVVVERHRVRRRLLARRQHLPRLLRHLRQRGRQEPASAHGHDASDL